MRALIRTLFPLTMLLTLSVWCSPWAGAQETTEELDSEQTKTEAAAEETEDDEAERNQRFADQMTGVKFIGRFTVLDGQGEGGEMPEEEYTIRKCEKLPQGDLFRFTARIRYGDTDVEVPMDLPVKWAAGTPVITLENLWIPGLGTFSSRVVIHGDRYAGTWDHGPTGGHLFGRIESIEEEEKEARE